MKKTTNGEAAFGAYVFTCISMDAFTQYSIRRKGKEKVVKTDLSAFAMIKASKAHFG